jgi:pimeloyl-ACP methyl ester carboxylesterase
MRALIQNLLSLVLTIAGILLLLTTPSHSQSTFVPTRFTMVVEGPATASPVLLLPGLTSGREVFDSEAKLLVTNHRLYRVQVNGFAGQPAGPNASSPLLVPIVEELHQYLQANKLHPAVIGHSLGGLLGLMLAQAHPEDVQKLMIVDALPFYALVFNPQAKVEMVAPQAKAMREQLLSASDQARAAQSAETAAYLCKNAAGQDTVAHDSQTSDRTVMANAMYEDLTTDLRPGLANIKTQTVLLYPFDAAAVGPDPSRIDAVYAGAYKAMPNLTMHRIDNSRHFIMFDQPAAFDAQVQAFLR